MNKNDIDLILFAEKCNERINSVKTALIEIVYLEDAISSQFWYHYDYANVSYVEDDYILYEFYTNNTRSASFLTTFNAIKLERLLHMNELKLYKDHYHILISDSTISIDNESESDIFTATKKVPKIYYTDIFEL